MSITINDLLKTDEYNKQKVELEHKLEQLEKKFKQVETAITHHITAVRKDAYSNTYAERITAHQALAMETMVHDVIQTEKTLVQKSLPVIEDSWDQYIKSGKLAKLIEDLIANYNATSPSISCSDDVSDHVPSHIPSMHVDGKNICILKVDQNLEIDLSWSTIKSSVIKYSLTNSAKLKI